MTLCAAWIRQANDTEELVFATDSTLTGGERWDHGIKLFELPRKDCLLSFAGSTLRAYPLVLNLVSSITFDKYLDSPSTNIEEVLKHIAELFSELIQKIVKEVDSEDIHELRSGARFIFGGWDWQRGIFRVWELFYSKEVEGFLFTEVTDDNSKTRFYTFVGDAKQEDFSAEAKKQFKQLLFDEDKLDSKLDMEPLKLLRKVALDTTIREVGGSLQIAKVYKSGRTEFFGIAWPSSDSPPYFQGRKYNQVTKPPVRYLNPDTFEVMDMDLPDKICMTDETVYGVHIDFVRECYPNGVVNDAISERDRYRIKNILKEVAYRQFMERQQQDAAEEVTV
ncbi:hypothetical protein [Thiothrix nivea]|uniref:Uncharacterized protein n=1 Tax=Thiothrix nivea (strain ATCC 35100 / DSM 5205 / JP2) TaxID=870187 RepID=A0A656HBC8_THINJ|nr:hypothetical protein [Thiothrix nivea]EIJ34431.1 hypothetical protein Thini_1852 [Thiothrix nivea DSM 5205]